MAEDQLKVDTQALAGGGRQLWEDGNAVAQSLQRHVDRLAQIRFKDENDRFGDRLSREFDEKYPPGKEELHRRVAEIAGVTSDLGDGVSSAAAGYTNAEDGAAKSVSS
jgi:hypothetical protein